MPLALAATPVGSARGPADAVTKVPEVIADGRQTDRRAPFVEVGRILHGELEGDDAILDTGLRAVDLRLALPDVDAVLEQREEFGVRLVQRDGLA